MWKWEWICWFVNLISRGGEDRVRRFRRLIERLSREADSEGDWWTVYREYPKQPRVAERPAESSAHGVTVMPSGHPARRECADSGHDSVALVMQGPLVDRDDLTVQTLRMYRSSMPQAKLIFSTWETLSTEQRERIEAIGVTVVTSHRPGTPGPQNLNLQLVSTRRGLSEAERIGCRFALKTRSDTRIHLPDADRFLMDLLFQFPVDPGLGQQARLIGLDFATRLYIPFHLSDMMMFGTTADLATYWSCDPCGPEMQFTPSPSFGETIAQSIPEVVLCRHFLSSVGEDVEVATTNQSPSDADLDRWWDQLAQRFLVVDREMIDHFWPKYNYHITPRLNRQWGEGNMAFCHFAQWLQLATRRPRPQVSLEQLSGQKSYSRFSQSRSGLSVV